MIETYGLKTADEVLVFEIEVSVISAIFGSPQARGRGRAEDSSYTLVAEVGSGVEERESVNEYREKMMSKAIAKICQMNRADYEKKVRIYFSDCRK